MPLAAALAQTWVSIVWVSPGATGFSTTVVGRTPKASCGRGGGDALSTSLATNASEAPRSPAWNGWTVGKFADWVSPATYAVPGAPRAMPPAKSWPLPPR